MGSCKNKNYKTKMKLNFIQSIYMVDTVHLKWCGDGVSVCDGVGVRAQL